MLTCWPKGSHRLSLQKSQAFAKAIFTPVHNKKNPNKNTPKKMYLTFFMEPILMNHQDLITMGHKGKSVL